MVSSTIISLVLYTLTELQVHKKGRNLYKQVLLVPPSRSMHHFTKTHFHTPRPVLPLCQARYPSFAADEPYDGHAPSSSFPFDGFEQLTETFVIFAPERSPIAQHHQNRSRDGRHPGLTRLDIQ